MHTSSSITYYNNYKKLHIIHVILRNIPLFKKTTSSQPSSCNTFIQEGIQSVQKLMLALSPLTWGCISFPLMGLLFPRNDRAVERVTVFLIIHLEGRLLVYLPHNTNLAKTNSFSAKPYCCSKSVSKLYHRSITNQYYWYWKYLSEAKLTLKCFQVDSSQHLLLWAVGRHFNIQTSVAFRVHTL